MKFSIVTPVYNLQDFISETIESVLSQQGDFEIEYIVMDDGSQDSSASIAQTYAQKVLDGSYATACNKVSMRVIQQENTGMYEAINRGFAKCSGDIYAWINADDLYQPGAFAAMARVFSHYPDIQWLKGVCSTLDVSGTPLEIGVCYVYKQQWLALGIYGQESYFVQQDSVFWHAALWHKVAPMPKHYRSAADYWLWIQMAKHAPLWSVNVPVSFFRKREGQISKGVAKYKKEQWDARPRRSLVAWGARLFFAPASRLGKPFEKFFLWTYPLLFGRQRYIELVGGAPVKKVAQSYIC